MKKIIVYLCMMILLLCTYANATPFHKYGPSSRDLADGHSPGEVTLNIGQIGIIEDIDVAIELRGDPQEEARWCDYSFWLEHNGTSVLILESLVYYEEPGYFNVTFDDDAGAPIPGMTVDAVGVYSPRGSLADFDSMSLEGDWKLSWRYDFDLYGYTELYAWEITGTTADALVPVPEPTTMILFGLGILGLAGVSRKRY